MRLFVPCALAALAWFFLALSGAAQQTGETAPRKPAIVIADSVSVDGPQRLIARGNVRAYQGQTELRAQRIVFDRAGGTLTIDGPIRISDGEAITILADAAALDTDLRNGLMDGARLILDQQLQLASVRLTRRSGRYSQLYKTVVTSCHICETGRAPLWQIRARRVVHDEQERQLYFDHATFHIGRLPILYLPRLRLPDPTLKRANGFLIPSVRSTSQLGIGIKVPYFFRLGDHADLTLEPYVSARTRTLGFRYRHAFALGGIAFNGAYTRDDLIAGETRGYLFAEGAFLLASGRTLSFNIEYASDNAYLADYGLPDQDRLETSVEISKVARRRYSAARLIHYTSLRDSEDDALLATVVAQAVQEYRLFPAAGGELRLRAGAHAHYRRSDADADGRDLARVSTDATWLKSWILRGGLRADAQAGLAADAFAVAQDSAYDSTLVRLIPSAALTLRYPMQRARPGGAVQILEPVMQIAWSQIYGDDAPDDQSGRVEFDQGNLIALSRFPAHDAREEGPRLAVGVNWSHIAPADGWQAHLSVGQILRETAMDGFSVSSGLSGSTSDLLIAGQLRTPAGFDLTGRALLDSAFDLTKAELRGDWRGKRTSIGGSYIWLEADAGEGRANAVSEIYLDGSHRINRFWTANANWRYDLADTRAATAGIGLTYRNECVEIDLSLKRSYADSTSVEPSTDFGFTIGLRGFGASDGTEKYVRSCT